MNNADYSRFEKETKVEPFPETVETRPISKSDLWYFNAAKALDFPEEKLRDMSRKERRELIKERGMFKESRMW